MSAELAGQDSIAELFALPDAAEILDDFSLIGIPGSGAIVRADTPPSLAKDIGAAFIAHQLRIGLGYARKRYVAEELPSDDRPVARTFGAMIKESKSHLVVTAGRFEGTKPDAKLGEVASEAALSRLTSTMQAAALLFRTGYLFEAHAVLRQFIEQVAWSYSVRDLETEDALSAVTPTRAVSDLRAVLPNIGRTYGFLSDRTHLSRRDHGMFVDEDGKVVLRHGWRSVLEGVLVPYAADAWAVVFELTQRRFMMTLESWIEIDGDLTLRPDRPFWMRAEQLRAELFAHFRERAA
jgi:hypothetical protein